MADDEQRAGDANAVNMGAGATAGPVATGSHINQVIIDKVIVEAQRAVSASRFFIPPPTAEFVGRADQVTTLCAQLASEGGVTISGLAGFGGVGKTELARVVAHRLRNTYPEGCEVDLHGASGTPMPPSEAMGRIVRLFTGEQGKLPEDADELRALYANVLDGRRALIVLDDAQDAGQVRDLVGARGCAFLITSRTFFVLKGMTPLRLDVLKPDEAKQLLLKLCPRLVPSPQPSPQKGEGDVVGALAELCGYLPLALEIAGSFLGERDDDVNEYVQDLKARRLDVLKRKGEKDFGVAAFFDKTYERLSVQEQWLWRVLGVFPGSFTAEAAEYVWGVEKGHQVLQELRRYSLVGERNGRYELHDLLKAYARTKLQQAEQATAEKRHAEFYLEVARAADELYLEGGDKTRAGLELFERELTNVRAGRAWGASHAQQDKDAARLASEYPDAAAYVMNLRLGVGEQIQWREEALAAARILGDKGAEGAHLGNLGNAYRNLGDVSKAIAYYEQALAIDKEIGDRRGEGAHLGNLGLAYADLGEVSKAIAYYEQALGLARELGDRRGEGNVLGNLGLAYAALGEVSKAIAYYEQALGLARELGDRRGEGADLGNLGNAYADLGEVSKAIAYYEQALVIAREIGDRRGEGNRLGSLGVAYWSLDEVQKAIGYVEQALVIAREIGDRRGEGNRLNNLGEAYWKLGEREKAFGSYKLALTIAREIGDRRGEGNALENLGAAYKGLGENEKARANWSTALEIFVAIQDRTPRR